MRKSVRPVLPAVALAVIAAGIVLPAISSNAQSGSRDITLREKVKSVKIDHVKSRSKGQRLSQGDRVTTRQTLFDASNKRIGTLYTDCVNLGATASLFKATLQCTATYRLGDGQIVIAGIAALRPGQHVPIVGGTGAYRGATGEAETAAPVKGYDTVDILHLDR